MTPSMQPVLQIIHVSDMHVVATRHPAAQVARRLRRLAARLKIQPLVNKLDDGLAPHDTFAPIMFREFIERIAVADPIWSKRPTWVIDTGDQTTFGDDASLFDARAHLASFASATGQTVGNNGLTNIYGNHDAWPEDLPLGAAARIAAHRAKLENAPHGFAVEQAQSPFRATVLANGADIQLFTIDTVNDDSWSNTWAKGSVSDTQLDDLQRAVLAWSTDGKRHLRILATHHPIHFPPPRPNLTMSVENDDHIGTRLSNATPSVHVVVSGHTHALYPAHGSLPPHARLCPHDHLGRDQCQLVVGTLMQLDALNQRGDHPHQCQVLRFYQDPNDGRQVVVERHLAARNPYASQPRFEYDFVRFPNGRSAEEIVLSL